jgi:hypothetical protein
VKAHGLADLEELILLEVSSSVANKEHGPKLIVKTLLTELPLYK